MSTQYWEEEIETMSREKLQELQLQRLKKTISIAANAPYYKEVFSKHGITSDSIQSLDDIVKYRSRQKPICVPTTLSDWWREI